MTTRHKQVEVVKDTLQVPTGIAGIKLTFYNVDHLGKNNHVIHGSFCVHQTNTDQIHDIKFYVLDELQLVNWFLMSMRSTYYSIINDCMYYSGQVISNNFRLGITSNSHIYFALDNRYSTLAAKQVSVSIHEEWDEQLSSLDLVTTMPPDDKSLNDDVIQMIERSKGSLKIISPYIDMSFIAEILKKIKEGVNIQIITRTRKEFIGKDKKASFDYISQNIQKNHRTNEYVHSRIIIRDSNEALISSADLTQDSLVGQFNAGIIVSESNVIKKLLDYFEKVWTRSSFA